MGYRLSRKAEEEIIAIFLHTAEQFGLEQAKHYHDLLEKTFRFLADNPLAARERDELEPPIRIHPIASHIVLYTTDAEHEVFIVRVRHRREEWLSATE